MPTRTRASTDTRTHAPTHPRTHARKHKAHTRTQARTQASKHTRTHARTKPEDIHALTRSHAHKLTPMHAHMYICTGARTGGRTGKRAGGRTHATHSRLANTLPRALRFDGRVCPLNTCSQGIRTTMQPHSFRQSGTATINDSSKTVRLQHRTREIGFATGPRNLAHPL